ncbi:MAG: chemotaxis protein CheW [Spirochaetota bacterium]
MKSRQDDAVHAIDAADEENHIIEEESVQLLSFLQGRDIYGLPIRTVREVIDTINITTIPLVPDYIRGVINLRGKVIPVIDLQARFGYGQSDVKKTSSIIINEIPVEDDIVEIGLMIDQVKEVMMFPKNSIDETPDFGTTIRNDFISGIGRYADNYIVILHTERLLNIDELSRFTAAGTTHD